MFLVQLVEYSKTVKKIIIWVEPRLMFEWILLGIIKPINYRLKFLIFGWQENNTIINSKKLCKKSYYDWILTKN